MEFGYTIDSVTIYYYYRYNICYKFIKDATKKEDN